MVARGNAQVRVEFEDGRVFAFKGHAFIREDVIEDRFEDRNYKLLSKKTLDRTEVMIHAESTQPSTGR